MTEYKIVTRHTYIIDEQGKHKTLMEKISKKNQYSYFERQNKKTSRLTSEQYHNEYAKTITEPTIIRKKEEKVKEQKQYDEYEYFIGFDYKTPSVKSGKHNIYGAKGRHDFKTEFKITSPVKLNEHEIQKLITDKFPDYSNVLKNDECYEIKSDEVNKVNEKPSITIKMTEKITR
jgi:hypothetical protein